MAIKSENTCLKKARKDEELFVLRGQDFSSPRTILYWIASNFENTDKSKLLEAFECALRMKQDPHRKKAD